MQVFPFLVKRYFLFFFSYFLQRKKSRIRMNIFRAQKMIRLNISQKLIYQKYIPGGDKIEKDEIYFECWEDILFHSYHFLLLSR